jgi:ppGpp synthetase/RelA/SpoT-type nucleotidyltranferase
MTCSDFAPYRTSALSFARSAASHAYTVLQTESSLLKDSHTSISWRIKSEAAIIKKLSDPSRFIGDHERTINDFIGIRILCPHLGLVDRFIAAIGRWSLEMSLLQVQQENTIEDPGTGGYRAIHLDYIFAEDNSWGFSSFITLELQLMTWLQLLHTEISHRYFYKAIAPDPGLQVLLENLSSVIHVLDRDFAERQLLRLRTLTNDDCL